MFGDYAAVPACSADGSDVTRLLSSLLRAVLALAGRAENPRPGCGAAHVAARGSVTAKHSGADKHSGAGRCWRGHGRSCAGAGGRPRAVPAPADLEDRGHRDSGASALTPPQPRSRVHRLPPRPSVLALRSIPAALRAARSEYTAHCMLTWAPCSTSAGLWIRRDHPGLRAWRDQQLGRRQRRHR